MNAIYFIANIAALKAINTAELPNGTRRVVANPGTGLLPSEYVLFKNVTRTEVLPIVVVPTALTTDHWIAVSARTIVSNVAPTTPPLFIGQRWINTATSPIQVYEAVGTAVAANWLRI